MSGQQIKIKDGMHSFYMMIYEAYSVLPVNIFCQEMLETPITRDLFFSVTGLDTHIARLLLPHNKKDVTATCVFVVQL